MAGKNKKALSSCSKQKEQFCICRLYLSIQMRILCLKCPLTPGSWQVIPKRNYNRLLAIEAFNLIQC